MSESMLDVYVYHTNPEQLINYEKQSVYDAACKRVYEWLYDQVGSNKHLIIEKAPIARSSGVKYMSFMVLGKHAHELDMTALQLRVYESGLIEMIDEYDRVEHSTYNITHDDKIMTNLEEVVNHYDEDYGNSFFDDDYY